MHCHKETEQEPVEPLDATAPAPLTDVQGHALLGVGLQLVVVDGHLPLEQQDSRAGMEPPGSSPFPEEACLPWCLWSSESPGPCERAPPPLSTHQAAANQQGQGRQGPWGHRAHSPAACDTARPRPPPCHGHTADLCRSLPLSLRGPPKPAPFSGVPPFTPQTHLSTFSVSGAGVLGSRYEGSPSPPEPESSKRG